MTYPSNAPGLLARAKHFNDLYKDRPNVICTALIVIGLLPYMVSPTFLFGLGHLMQLVGYGVLLFAAISRNLIKGDKTKQQRRTFYVIAGAIILFIPVPPLPAFILLLFLLKPASRVIRGQEVVSVAEVQRLLKKRQDEAAMPQLPLLEIGGVQLPNDLENLGVFAIGSPGSGKTQAIKKLLETLRDREDFRVMVLDRNGELMESFYNEDTDKLFNPRDARSVSWSHLSEGQQPETMAAAMVPLPQNEDKAFFAQAARSLLSDLYERCDSNAQIWEVISRYSHDELKAFVSGGLSTRIFDGERMTASVLATMVNYMRFYRDMDDGAQPFSFSQWAKYDNPEWLFLPIFEDDAEKYKPMVSAAFEMALRGMLSNENRWMKTAIVIDELGALNKLGSLNRLTAESRKFGGTLILGTQTDAQIDKVYGEFDTRIMLQGTATKLILNCRDEKTAERFAKTIGKQERIDWMKGTHGGWIFRHGYSKTENLRETHLVLPSELQALPKLEGYLTIADGTPPARVRVEPKGYLKQAERFVSKH
ncbi:MAG: type IV secretion system DNA-binding domain-containing protein [Cyanobacteria bacterium J06621_3]